jgi:type II secretory ATPase GspE/PulE/Tfp pilus assembly ATPase PilB-like protein
MKRPLLLIQVGDQQVRKVISGPQVTIGRDPSNSLAFNDSTMSRFHCVLDLAGDRVAVKDLDSSGGTLVNDSPVQTARLVHGDVIRIGRITVTLLFEDPDAPNTGSPADARSASAPARSAPSAPSHKPSRTQGSTPSSSKPRPDPKNPAKPADATPPPRSRKGAPKTPPPTRPDDAGPPQHTASPTQSAKGAKPGPKWSAGDLAGLDPTRESDPGRARSNWQGPERPLEDQERLRQEQEQASQLREEVGDEGLTTGYTTRLAPRLPLASHDADAINLTPDDVREADRRAPRLAGQEDAVEYRSVTPQDPETSEDRSPTEELIAAALNHAHVLSKVIDSLPDHSLTYVDLKLTDSKNKVVTLPTRSMQEAVRAGKEGILLLIQMMLLCQRIRATDLHFEPRSGAYDLRLRVDGVMVHILDVHRALGIRLQRIVKVLTHIDITQGHAIQEGHFSIDVPDRRIHYRVSFTPALHGQKLVIRVLDISNSPQRIADLGLPAWMEREIRAVVNRDTGMLLACGPTGSGKTSTLYTLLRAIDRNTRNVITIEDPVEYEIEGVTQLPINAEQGHSFASMLRSVLRQDPDVLLIGEVRDNETAKIAMQSALTGHLVFSTVHARDAVGTIFRLIDLGIERYLVASAINLILAQRLGRLLCATCKRKRKLEPREVRVLASHGVENLYEAFEPVGCDACLQTGYYGRKAFFEMLNATDQVRDIILNSLQIQDIRKAVRSSLFASLHATGYQLVAEGLTAVDEIDRVVGATT